MKQIATFVLCSVVKHPGSGRAVETLDDVSCLPLHILCALSLPLSCSTASYCRLTSSVITVNLSNCELELKTIELDVVRCENSWASQPCQKSRSLW